MVVVPCSRYCTPVASYLPTLHKFPVFSIEDSRLSEPIRRSRNPVIQASRHRFIPGQRVKPGTCDKIRNADCWSLVSSAQFSYHQIGLCVRLGEIIGGSSNSASSCGLPRIAADQVDVH
jgi:hypothetical protein